MSNSSDMKYMLLDLDLRRGRVRIGSCVVWAIAFIVLAWTGHLLFAAPASIPAIWKWIRGG
jgi:hypothetical protein